MRNEKGQFVKGHKGYLPAGFSDHMKKISKERGYGKWNKGKKTSEETKKKISNAHKGRKMKKEDIEKSVETRRMNGGYVVSEETKTKMSLTRKGRKLSEETKRKISKSLKEKNSGEKNGMWNNGSSYFPYSVNWTITLRRSIRERDRYTCQICGEEQGDKGHDVHHIDYNRLNCDPNNLITLCKSCHGKTGKNRKEWIIYFNNRII
jgi:5-methylcytosine-specific restriction endonuclease McrA